jgi:hypothetical protein
MRTAAGLRSRTALAVDHLFLREQLAVFQEREKKAAPRQMLIASSKRATFFDCRSALSSSTNHLDQLPSGIPPILELEIETGRAATGIGRSEVLHSSNGSRKSDVGRRADCK